MKEEHVAEFIYREVDKDHPRYQEACKIAQDTYVIDISQKPMEES